MDARLVRTVCPEWYQTLVLRVSTVDFSEFTIKLQEFAEKERRAQLLVDEPLQRGEGFASLLKNSYAVSRDECFHLVTIIVRRGQAPSKRTPPQQ